MSKTRFCNQCGAPLQPKMLFCERCGALAGAEYDEPQSMTERMSTSQPTERMVTPQPADRLVTPQPEQEPSERHSEVQPPIPVMRVPRQPHPQPRQTKTPEEKKGDSHDSEVLGWVVAIALAILLAAIIGYVVGTADTSKGSGSRRTASDGTEQEWQYGTYDSADDETDKKTSQSTSGNATNTKTNGNGSDSKVDKTKESENKDNQTDKDDDKKTDDADSTDDEDDSEKIKKTDDKDDAGSKDDKTDKQEEQEAKETEMMRESVNHEMELRPDGMLNIGLSVPDDGSDISERVEVTQDGRLVYSTRIVTPGETLKWVPSDHAHVGKAKAYVYGIKGDEDWGSPVTIEVDIVSAESSYAFSTGSLRSSQI